MKGVIEWVNLELMKLGRDVIIYFEGKWFNGEDVEFRFLWFEM